MIKKRANGRITHRKNLNQLATFCRREVIKPEIRGNKVFDPGGGSGSLCGCLFLEGRLAETMFQLCTWRVL